MVDPDGPVPLYQQVKQHLRRAVQSGAFGPHTPIPSERELIAQFGVSRITVRQAIADLVAEGLLYRRHGSGTYAAPQQVRPISATLSKLTGHVEELQLRGYQPVVELLELSRIPMPPEVSLALERGDGAEGWHLRRLVRVDGHPLLVLDGYLPSDLDVNVGPAELERLPIPQILESAGILPVEGALTIAARAASPAEAAFLEVDPGAAVLQVTRIIRGRQSRPVEWSRALYRSDRYQYEVELRRR